MVLHLWLIWSLENLSHLTEMLNQKKEEQKPLSVRLKRMSPELSADEIMQQNRPNLIDDNPNANKEKVAEAQILSTENSSAQEGGGSSVQKEIPRGNVENSDEEFIPEGADGFSSSLVGKNLAAGKESDALKEKAMLEKVPIPSPKSGIGASFSLSSYAWDWAPWVLDLRDKFGRTINPPPIYSRLGLVSGLTRVKFVINRDGTLASYTVLSHAGHEVLEKTTVESIQAVFPFKPLPEDFPDPKLVIIGNFIYPDLRKLYGR